VIKLVTIGVYGADAETFFAALETAGVDTFCDLRARRGVRGAEYAYANSQRLQARLAAMGIHYLHRKDLAPTPEIRRTQHAVDKTEKVARRKRTELSPAFMAAYQEIILANFDPQSLRDELPADAQVVALHCVEREPAACHRSLVADYLQAAWGCAVEHLVP